MAIHSFRSDEDTEFMLNRLLTKFNRRGLTKSEFLNALVKYVYQKRVIDNEKEHIPAKECERPPDKICEQPENVPLSGN